MTDMREVTVLWKNGCISGGVVAKETFERGHSMVHLLVSAAHGVPPGTGVDLLERVDSVRDENGELDRLEWNNHECQRLDWERRKGLPWHTAW